MLPQLYQTCLQKYLTPSQLVTLEMLVWLLQVHKQIKLERLAANLPIPIMFRDCKSGGYNLEGSYASCERIINLVLLIAIAYTISFYKEQNLRKLDNNNILIVFKNNIKILSGIAIFG
ncbi:MAG TPA: hypothetical protein V6C71_05045 [Coleofasciculaceae cyanobacterium]|jgi:hypothetical protein